MLNQIICGDCIELMKQMDSNSVHLTLTDIPYDVVSRRSAGLRNFDKGDADILTFNLSLFLEHIVRITSGSIYIFCSTEQVSEIRKYLVESKLSTRLCIWQKSNPPVANCQFLHLSDIETCVYGKKPKATFNGKYKSSVWKYPTVRNKLHPTAKPLKLFEYLVDISSNVGDIVFDPLVGSGTTCLAAQNLNRNFIGIDINPEYCEVVRQRLNNDRSNKNDGLQPS